MLELLEHIVGYCFILVVLSILLYALWVLFTVTSDINLLSESTRCLFRNGKANHQVNFQSKSFDLIWRKLLAFYHGVSRSTKVKSDAEMFMLGSLEMVNASIDSKKVLQVLVDIVLKTTAPESRFAALAEFSRHDGSWSVSAASGISKTRLEDPFLLALNNLPLQSERNFIYTSIQNGSDFDFRGLGVGLSLFVPIVYENDLIGMLWLGLSAELGTVSDSKREAIEIILQHAISSFVTAKKSEQKSKKSEDHKDRILSLSHDLKAPSVRAMYALRELKSSQVNLNSVSLTLINEIEYAIDEQLGLIGELFNIDKIEQNIQRPNEAEVVSLIKSRLDSFKVVARSVNLELRVGTLQRAQVRIPRDALSRILDNLLSNAIKYTNSGFVKISSEAVGSKLEIRVEDSGPGVRPDLLPFLFSSKMREKQKLENSGNGFGLSAVKKLLEDYGASIDYSEKSEGGSIFSITLPVIAFLESAKGKLNKSVLIIDDDSVVRNSHHKWIKNLAEKVWTAESFSEAISMLEFKTPSLIITDMNIPSESFYDFTTSIPAGIKVLILTGNPRDQIGDTFSNMDFIAGIIEKPVDKRELRQVVEEILDGLPADNNYEKAA